MNDLLTALSTVVVKRELDLSKLDAAYVVDGKALKLPYRANLTRGQKECRVELNQRYAELHVRAQKALDTIQRAALGEGDASVQIGQMDTGPSEAEFDEMSRAWNEWWAAILLLDPGQVDQLVRSLPDSHWQWITSEVLAGAALYEREALKNPGGPPSGISEKPERAARQSGKKRALRKS